MSTGYQGKEPKCLTCGVDVNPFIHKIRHGHCAACHEKMAPKKPKPSKGKVKKSATDRLGDWLEKAKSKGKKQEGPQKIGDIKLHIPALGGKKRGVKLKKLKGKIKAKLKVEKKGY